MSKLIYVNFSINMTYQISPSQENGFQKLVTATLDI